MRDEIGERVERAIAERVFPGCVIGTIRANGFREILPFGRFTYEPNSLTVREDSVFDLASVTKSIPVASLALLFIEQARFNLADRVTKYVPELRNDYDATIEDLLKYRVSGLRLSTLHHETPNEILNSVFKHGFDRPPGIEAYTNLPAFLLGVILERIGGETLDILAQKYFFESLAMSRATFFPKPSDCVPTEIIDGTEILGIVHDESARVFSRAHRAVGHAGLFSTAGDMLLFLEALMKGKFPAVLDGAQKGWGWQKAEPWFMGSHVGEGAFGKTGFTGTSVAVDPARGIGFVILSNRTYPRTSSRRRGAHLRHQCVSGRYCGHHPRLRIFRCLWYIWLHVWDLRVHGK
jgi:CubicO group peptidase (beta-lactamase class C family)